MMIIIMNMKNIETKTRIAIIIIIKRKRKVVKKIKKVTFEKKAQDSVLFLSRNPGGYYEFCFHRRKSLAACKLFASLRQQL